MKTSIVKAVNESGIKHLEGKLLTVIEGIGLPNKQEEAIKSIVRNDIWDSWEQDMAFVPPEICMQIYKIKMTSLEGEKIKTPEELGY